VFTAATTSRYATPLSAPLTLTTTYAPAFATASSLLPPNVTTTSYSLDRSATTLQDGRYGQGAYARLWQYLTWNSTMPFTTTVSPTPVASSELIFPPALYTACPSTSDSCVDCYKLPSNFIWGVAGSAFQIEGGLDFEGRGPGTLDVIGALPNTEDAANAETADMNYLLYSKCPVHPRVCCWMADTLHSKQSKTFLGLRPSGYRTIRSRFPGQGSCLSGTSLHPSTSRV